MANLTKSNRAMAPWNDFLKVDNFFNTGLKLKKDAEEALGRDAAKDSERKFN